MLFKRRAALVTLTVVCVLAHAAALGGLSHWQAGLGRDVAQADVLFVTHVRTTMRDTPLREGAVAEPGGVEPAPLAKLTPRRAAIPTEPPGAMAPAPAAPAPTAPPSATETAIDHLPTSALDVSPMPRSAPDEQYVENVHRSGLPMQLRLFIDASGSVTEARLLSAAPGDEEAAEQALAMFRDTAFSPGRLHGREVASFIDIELMLEPALPPLGRIVRQ